MPVRCVDPEIFEASARWRKLGLEIPEQVRYEVLSRDEWPPEVTQHLTQCAFCRELAESVKRLHGALHAPAGQTVAFAVCPSAEALAGYHYEELAEDQKRAIKEHLKRCPACQVEARWLTVTEEVTPGKMLRKRWYFPVAAAVMIGSMVTMQDLQKSVPKPQMYADPARAPQLDT